MLTCPLRQVSLHLRGPLNLQQMAVYTLTSSISGRAIKADDDTLSKLEGHHPSVPPGGVGTPLSPMNEAGDSRFRRSLDTHSTEPSTFVTMARAPTKARLEPRQTPIRADWRRIASYTSAASAQATGLRFLANLGDPRKSGTFD